MVYIVNQNEELIQNSQLSNTLMMIIVIITIITIIFIIIVIVIIYYKSTLSSASLAFEINSLRKISRSLYNE